jgi:hypothetical protein
MAKPSTVLPYGNIIAHRQWNEVGYSRTGVFAVDSQVQAEMFPGGNYDFDHNWRLRKLRHRDCFCPRFRFSLVVGTEPIPVPKVPTAAFLAAMRTWL